MRLAIIEKLECILNYSFKNKDLLIEAITHPSYIGAKGSDASAKSYERFEFLGDSVLGFVVADLVFDMFPEDNEGRLSERHTSLVRGSVLSEIALELGMGDFIIMSDSESSSGGRKKKSNLENVFEAIIGAIYIDDGISAVKGFIETHWVNRLKILHPPAKDFKTSLQEIVQSLGLPVPIYEIANRSGPAHEPIFTVKVFVEGYEPKSGSGRNKKEAEMVAAKCMLKVIN